MPPFFFFVVIRDVNILLLRLQRAVVEGKGERGKFPKEAKKKKKKEGGNRFFHFTGMTDKSPLQSAIKKEFDCLPFWQASFGIVGSRSPQSFSLS